MDTCKVHKQIIDFLLVPVIEFSVKPTEGEEVTPVEDLVLEFQSLPLKCTPSAVGLHVMSKK